MMEAGWDGCEFYLGIGNKYKDSTTASKVAQLIIRHCPVDRCSFATSALNQWYIQFVDTVDKDIKRRAARYRATGVLVENRSLGLPIVIKYAD